MICESCQGPRSKWSSGLCRCCYEGRSSLTGSDSERLRNWVRDDRLTVDDEGHEYLRGEAKKRGLSFGQMVTVLLQTIADEEIASAILDN